MSLSDLSGDQARQTIDVGQVFSSFATARAEWARRYAGSMSWKTVGGRDYLYRKRREAWKSLGPRTPETEAIATQFHEGRARLQERIAGLTKRLDAMAPVNRALNLGRLPVIAARILRALDEAGLIGTGIEVVGTNALFAYERLAGVQIASAHLATADVDLLFDARRSLRLLAPEVSATGVVGLLRKVDRSFEVLGRNGFRAVNRDGYLVDLIMPTMKDRMAKSPRSRIGSEATDLEAVEIEGLGWLVNSPKAVATVLDARGYPLTMVVPDPRAFALHKLWLAERQDRDPLKRQRDRAQADLVAGLVTSRLPHLHFDDPALTALPRALREQATLLTAARRDAASGTPRLEPDW
ncbi:nucleotidyltransferase domain-containing protein [Methylobacterium sp. WL69]|uniref:GSU2403 family nucleotidyltransferase fold protein n=1 Tax=Methylobacterium sp. WL69 TaxID=2603893 RepID=UPI001FF03EBB|nr:nucleotidyltransferase domain-containing protein [Methylobacterium sp. WL69]